jgi:flagellar motility protein MotE (MotC chaperone)
MISLLQSSWMAALVGGLLYLGTTAVLLKPTHFTAARPESRHGFRSPNDDPSWRFRNPEFDQLLVELRREQEALALRAQELQDLQNRLAAERQELSSITQLVHQLQIEFDRNVVRFKDQETENLKRRVKVITAMSPEGASGLLAEMPDDDVVKLFALMKPDEVSGFLDTLSKSGSAGAKRAVALTDKMRLVLPAASPARPGRSP